MALDLDAINGVKNETTYQTKEEAESSVDVSEFFDLMVAQLQNQDPTNPMEEKDFLAQMAQFEALNETRKLNTSIQTLVNSQQFSQTASLIGREITAVDTDTGASNTGIVERVRMKDGSAVMVLAETGKEIKIEDITEIAPVYIQMEMDEA